MSDVQPVGVVKPCPFCGIQARVMGDLAGCDTLGCPASHRLFDRQIWNHRALCAGNEARHPMADVARLCIVNAVRKLEQHPFVSDVVPEPVMSAHRYLRQALNALRPPASPEPASTTFWLGGNA